MRKYFADKYFFCKKKTHLPDLGSAASKMIGGGVALRLKHVAFESSKDLKGGLEHVLCKIGSHRDPVRAKTLGVKRLLLETEEAEFEAGVEATFVSVIDEGLI